MKTVLSLVLCSVLLAGLVSCGDMSRKTGDMLEVREIRLNSSDGDAMIGELVDSVSFLKLRETEESYFVAINKILVHDGLIYVFDKFGKNSLVAFDMQGRFVTSYGRRGNGENEYARLWDFDVCDSTVWLYDRMKKRMLCYATDGSFRRIVDMPFRAKSFKLVADGKILFAMGKEDGQGKVCLTNREMEVEREFFSYREEDLDDYTSDNYFRVGGDTVYYNNAVNDSVYMFSMDGELRGCYHFDFNGNNVPEGEKGNYEKLSDDAPRFGYVYLHEVPMMAKEHVIGLVTNGGEAGLFLYDKRTGRGSVKNWTVNELKLSDIILPAYVADGYILGWMDASVYEALADKEEVPSDLAEYMDEGGRVLIFYHLKQ